MSLQEQHDAKRKEYMNGSITHADFYLWLAAQVGVTIETIAPHVRSLLPTSKDEHLNDVPLRMWDNHHPLVTSLAGRAGMRAWSLSDTVCVLKAVARKFKDSGAQD